MSTPTPPPPPFAIEIEDQGPTALVHCRGRLIYGQTDLLYKPLLHLLPTHETIILDLSELTQLDSLGMGALVRLYVAAKARGCTIELRHLSQKIRELLIMTNLITIFGSVGEHNIRM